MAGKQTVTVPMINFLVDDGDEDSDLALPDLKDDSNFADLAEYVRLRRPNVRKPNLAPAPPPAELFAKVKLMRKTIVTPNVQPQEQPQQPPQHKQLPPAPQPVEPVRAPASRRSTGRRPLHEEFADAVSTPSPPPASVLGLEQTLNVTHFDLVAPGFHSTPHHGPPRKQAASVAPPPPLLPPASSSTVAVPEPTPTPAAAAAAAPAAASININLNIGTAKEVAVDIPKVNTTTTTAAPSLPSVVEPRSSPRRKSTQRPPVDHSQATTPQRPLPVVVHVSTPRPTVAAPAAAGPQTPQSSQKFRLALRQSLRDKCAEQQRQLDQQNEQEIQPPADQNGQQAKASTSIEQMPPPPAPASTTRIERAASPQATMEPVPQPHPPVRQRTSSIVAYDMDQYIRNVAETDIIHDNSPTTSQTLQANLLQRERPTFQDSQSLRMPRRVTRTKNAAAVAAAHEIAELTQTLRMSVNQHSTRRRPLYSKGDSLLDSPEVGSQEDERAETKQPPPPQQQRGRKRRSAEMMARPEADHDEDVQQLQTKQPVLKLHRVVVEKSARARQRLMTNSRRDDDDELLTSDDDDVGKANQKPPQVVRRQADDEDDDDDGEISENDILDSFRETSMRSQIDTAADDIRMDWQTTEDEGAAAASAKAAEAPPPKASHSKVPVPVRSRIPQPRSRVTVQKNPAVDSRNERRGTYTVANAAENGRNDRRGTYTKSKAHPQSDESDESEDVDEVEQPVEHAAPSHRRVTYTKSRFDVGEIADVQQEAISRRTFTKSQRHDNDESTKQQPKRGTYTKAATESSEEDDEDKPPKRSNAESQRKPNRGTYTKTAQVIESEAASFVESDADSVEMAVAGVHGKQKRHEKEKADKHQPAVVPKSKRVASANDTVDMAVEAISATFAHQKVDKKSKAQRSEEDTAGEHRRTGWKTIEAKSSNDSESPQPAKKQVVANKSKHHRSEQPKEIEWRQNGKKTVHQAQAVESESSGTESPPPAKKRAAEKPPKQQPEKKPARRADAVEAESDDEPDSPSPVKKRARQPKEIASRLRPSDETQSEDGEEADGQQPIDENESATFVPETQDPQEAGQNGFADSNGSSAYNLYSPALPLRMSDPMQRTTQSSTTEKRAPSDSREEFVRSTTDDEQPQPAAVQTPPRRKQQKASKRHAQLDIQSDSESEPEPQPSEKVKSKAANKKPVKSTSPFYESDEPQPAAIPTPPKRKQQKASKKHTRSDSEPEPEPQPFEKAKSKAANKKPAKSAKATANEYESDEEIAVQDNQQTKQRRNQETERSPSEQRMKPAPKKQRRDATASDNKLPTKNRQVAVEQVSSADGQQHSESDRSDDDQPMKQVTKPSKPETKKTSRKNDTNKTARAKPTTSSTAKARARSRSADDDASSAAENQPVKPTHQQKKKNQQYLSIRITPFDRNATTDRTENSFDRRTATQRRPPRNAQRHQRSPSSEAPSEEAVQDRAGKTTYQTMNMSTDGGDGDQTDQESNDEDDEYLAPATQFASHRTVCHAEDLHETIPETQHQLASEQHMDDYDEADDDHRDATDSVSDMNLHISDSSAATLASKRPRQRRLASVSRRSSRSSESSSSSMGDDQHATGFASDAGAEQSYEDHGAADDDDDDAQQLPERPLPTPSPEPPARQTRERRGQNDSVTTAAPVVELLPKRKRGRPPKNASPATADTSIATRSTRQTTAAKATPPSKARQSGRQTQKKKQQQQQQSMEASAATDASSANGSRKRLSRRKRHVPTMNSWEYHPFDRTPTQLDPSLRRSKRAPQPLKKYWVNEDELWSPLHVPAPKTAASRNGSKNGSVGRRQTSRQTRRRLDSVQEETSTASTTASTSANGTTADAIIGAGPTLADQLRNMLTVNNLAPSQDLPVLHNNDGRAFVADAKNMQRMSKNNIDYYVYDTHGLDTRGFMCLNGHAQKKRCKTTEQMEITVLCGTLTATIGDWEERDFEAGNLLNIQMGLLYKLRNRNAEPVWLSFCKRQAPVLWGEPSVNSVS